MNNSMEQIRKAAMVDELQKMAGKKSEVGATLLEYPINAPAALVGGIAALLKKDKNLKEEVKKQNPHTWQNLIPGLAGYRLGKRTYKNMLATD